MPDIYLCLESRTMGPYHPGQIRQMMKEKTIPPLTLAWHEGLAEWKAVTGVLADLPIGTSTPSLRFPPITRGTDMRPARNNGKRRVLLIAVMVCGVGIVLFSLLAGFAVLAVAWRYSMIQSPGDVPPELVRNAALIGQTRTIADLMLVYAQDHRGIYPTGKTSTEAFQKLLDGKYTSDPTVFYVDMPGKIRPTTMTLTSQNVCFDVTGGLTVTSSGRLPVAFTTGYIVDYSPGGGITLADETTAPLGGISVTFKNGVGANIPWKYDGIQRAFIEKDFDSKGSTFTQLRP